MIILITFITLLSLVIFSPIFKLSLWGDDWFAIFQYPQSLRLGPSSLLDNIKVLLKNPWGSQTLNMGLFFKLFGYQSTYYYAISFLFRILASVTLYPLIYYLTKNKLASSIAVIFFSITTIGLDTTNMAFTMSSFLSIAFFNLFLFFFLKSRGENKRRLLLTSTLLLYLAFVTRPIRMMGVFPFILITETFWLITSKQKKKIRIFLTRAVAFFTTFLLIQSTGNVIGKSGDANYAFSLGAKLIRDLLQQGRFDFLLYPVTNVGGLIIPTTIIKSTRLYSAIAISFLSFAFLTRLLRKSVQAKHFSRNNLLLGSVWTLAVIRTRQVHSETFQNPAFAVLTLIGGYFLILIFFLIKHFLKQERVSNGLFTSIVWIFSSFVFAWWRGPAHIYETTHRYLITSSLGIAIALATLFSICKNKIMFLSLIVLPLILTHAYTTHYLLNKELQTHSIDISNKIWASIPYFPKIANKEGPLVFYFDYDGPNGGIIHKVTFGFPAHMALLYNLSSEDPHPIPMARWEDLTLAVKDGSPLVHYGFPKKAANLDQIYAFRIEEQKGLVDITGQIRKKLSDEILDAGLP